MLNVFMSFVFYGTQMYFGGQAFVIILNALSPDFLHMSNTLPERSASHAIFSLPTSLTDLYSAGITTPGLIGFVLFIFLYFSIICWVPAYKVQKYLEVQVVVATVTLFGIMGYAVSANGGSAGNLVKPAITLSKTDAAFKIVQGITSVAGTYTGGTERVSDWTRYGKRRHTSTPAILALAFTVVLAALLGIIATSAFAEAYGVLQWNPLIMLRKPKSPMNYLRKYADLNLSPCRIHPSQGLHACV
jgi:NCS1 family nucleobase:cation symporter-1